VWVWVIDRKAAYTKVTALFLFTKGIFYTSARSGRCAVSKNLLPLLLFIITLSFYFPPSLSFKLKYKKKSPLGVFLVELYAFGLNSMQQSPLKESDFCVSVMFFLFRFFTIYFKKKKC